MPLRTVFFIITRNGFCSHLRKIIFRRPWPLRIALLHMVHNKYSLLTYAYTIGAPHGKLINSLPSLLKMSKSPWCSGPNHHLRRLINCPGIIIIISLVLSSRSMELKYSSSSMPVPQWMCWTEKCVVYWNRIQNYPTRIQAVHVWINVLSEDSMWPSRASARSQMHVCIIMLGDSGSLLRYHMAAELDLISINVNLSRKRDLIGKHEPIKIESLAIQHQELFNRSEDTQPAKAAHIAAHCPGKQHCMQKHQQ